MIILNISQIRDEIDKIDDEILKLFSRRMYYVKEISKLKCDLSLDVYDESRETQILERVCSETNEYKKETRKLFSEILQISKDFQRSLR